jgi:AraC family transcriptional regulator, regulatory protein of adaptative response / DNA-3-methyladenine glycosylase II
MLTMTRQTLEITAVTSTGIYCRPGCPARAPKPENVRRFATGAEAREAGFRACRRCRPDAGPGPDPLTRRLAYREPIDVEGLIAFFGRRAVSGIEEVADGLYRRSVSLPGGAGIIELRPARGHVAATLWLDDPRDVDAAVALCRAVLDLDADPERVVAALGGDAVIGSAVRAAPGRRVPGHAGAQELAIRAVLGQQVSLSGAATLAGRLVAAYGEPLARPIGGVTHLFPSSATLADADPATLAMPGSRRRAVLGLADALAGGEVALAPGGGVALAPGGGVALAPGGDRGRPEQKLLALPGIGPWTVAYIAMRALGDRDAFMPTDLGVRRGLEALGQDGRPGPAAALAEHWRPYRAYALQHLWAAASPRRRSAAGPPPRRRSASPPPRRRTKGDDGRDALHHVR